MNLSKYGTVLTAFLLCLTPPGHADASGALGDLEARYLTAIRELRASPAAQRSEKLYQLRTVVEGLVGSLCSYEDPSVVVSQTHDGAVLQSIVYAAFRGELRRLSRQQNEENGTKELIEQRVRQLLAAYPLSPSPSPDERHNAVLFLAEVISKVPAQLSDIARTRLAVLKGIERVPLLIVLEFQNDREAAKELERDFNTEEVRKLKKIFVAFAAVGK